LIGVEIFRGSTHDDHLLAIVLGAQRFLVFLMFIIQIIHVQYGASLCFVRYQVLAPIKHTAITVATTSVRIIPSSKVLGRLLLQLAGASYCPGVARFGVYNVVSMVEQSLTKMERGFASGTPGCSVIDVLPAKRAAVD
jgi:hypothetical protein